MRTIRVVNKTRESILGSQVAVADKLWSRVRGFLRRPAPEHGEGLLLSPCRAVHTVGMTFAIDVLFVGRGGRVIAVYPELQPNRRTAYHAGAEYALELPPGTAAASGTQPDDLLTWSPADAEERQEAAVPLAVRAEERTA